MGSKRNASRTSSRSTLNSLVTQFTCTVNARRKRKSATMKLKRRKRKKTMMNPRLRLKKSMKMTKRLKKLKKLKRKSLLNTSSKKNSTRPNLCGLEMSTIFPLKNTPSSTNRSPTIGKTTWPSNTSALKVNSSSKLSSSSRNALRSICSKTKSKRTPSSFTSDACSSVKTATNSCQNGCPSSKVSSTLKIFHSTFPEKLFNRTKS